MLSWLARRKLIMPHSVAHSLLLLALLAALLPSHHTLAQPADSSYRLVWADEFTESDFTAVNSTIWTHELGSSYNNELEYYTDTLNNSFVQNDALVIQSLYQPNYAASGYNFTSARINTMGKVELYMGYVEARIRVLTMADGHWPAFWMLGSCNQSYPNCGEIDIMEQVNGPIGNSNGNDKQQCGTLWTNVNGINGASNPSPHQAGGCINVPSNVNQWGDDWHVYAMKWNATAIDFLVDGSTYSSTAFGSNIVYDSYQTPSDPYYLIINLAEGGSNPGVAPDSSSFPTQMQVDYVRVWQQKDGKSYIKAPNAIALSSNNTNSSSTGGGGSGGSPNRGVTAYDNLILTALAVALTMAAVA